MAEIIELVTRFLVVGSGVAGLHTAWRASQHGEVLLLTTCNRVEIYAAADANIANEEIAQSLRIDGGPSSKNDFPRAPM